MFDVLAFVYENCWNGNDCPEPVTLQRRLHDVGFSPDQIGDALTWLGGLAQAAQGLGQAAAESPAQARLFDDAAAPVQPSLRIYTRGETERLGLQGVGFLCFLDAAGALSLPLRELVIERAVAARQAPLPLRDLKMILLMACRSVGYRPEALILDELCEDHAGRVVH